jgi:hypothetical protein
VSGKQSSGALPASTLDRVPVVRGVRTASGRITSVFRVVDARGKVARSRGNQLFTVGVDYSVPDTTDSKQVAGRDPRPGSGEIQVDSGWGPARADRRAARDRRRRAPPGVVPHPSAR